MATLVVTTGPAEGTQFSLGPHRLVLIGRDEECTFQILDPRVSRRHMQIKHDEASGGHAAIDHKSSTGVVVNDERIAAETVLADGDVIVIGETTIVYSVTDSPDASAIDELLRKRGEWRRSTLLND